MINLLNYLNYNYDNKTFLTLVAINFAHSQNYWQQHVDYQMDIDMNVEDFTLKELKKLFTQIIHPTQSKRFIIIYFLMLLNQTARWIFAQGQLETLTEEWEAE